MANHFQVVKGYLLDLNCNITFEDESDGILVVNDEDEGISNLVVGIADPILIMEQTIFEMKEPSKEIYTSLLRKNREIINGAFALDDTGTKVIFRNTLALENLDQNEVEASINSLRLLLSEYFDDLVEFAG